MTKEERIAILKDWVKALRSDEYTQCTGHFEKPMPAAPGWLHCSVGVLGDIVNAPEIKGASMAGRVSYIRNALEIDIHYFIRLNDEERLSFSEIADKIERNYLSE